MLLFRPGFSRNRPRTTRQLGNLICQGQQRVTLRRTEALAAVFPQEKQHKSKNETEAYREGEGNYRHGSWIVLGAGRYVLVTVTYRFAQDSAARGLFRSAQILCKRCVRGIESTEPLTPASTETAHILSFRPKTKFRTPMNNTCGVDRIYLCDKNHMHDSFQCALQRHRDDLRQRWETLLRAERITSGMALPDSLIYLMDWTLDQLMDEVRQSHYRRREARRATSGARSFCVCGQNPLLAYFATAEQAIVEVLFLVDADLSRLTPLERNASLDELKSALNEVARRDIESFCSVCQSKKQHEKQCPAELPHF